MYSTKEFLSKVNVSCNVLNKFRKHGLIKDKKEKRDIWNELTKQYDRKEIIVYDENDINIITKQNFIIFEGRVLIIPKKIKLRTITSKLANDKREVLDEMKFSFWVKKEKYCFEDALKKHDIAIKYRRYIEDNRFMFSNKTRMREIFNELTEKCCSVKELKGYSGESVWNKMVWVFYGFSLKDAEYHSKKIQKNNNQKAIESKSNGYNNPLHMTYWLEKADGDIETAKKMFSERQTTFSKENCIKKYGKKNGLEKWRERQEKWQDTMNNKPLKEIERINRAKMFKRSYSKISQELFIEIFNRLNKDKKKNCFFATLDANKEINDNGCNNEFCVHCENSIRFLDFFMEDSKHCIEFDGEFWHGKMGNIKREKERENEIYKAFDGIKIMRIMEKEFIENREGTVEKCLEFLLNEKNQNQNR
jgi:hypothetical protein